MEVQIDGLQEKEKEKKENKIHKELKGCETGKMNCKLQPGGQKKVTSHKPRLNASLSLVNESGKTDGHQHSHN